MALLLLLLLQYPYCYASSPTPANEVAERKACVREAACVSNDNY